MGGRKNNLTEDSPSSNSGLFTPEPRTGAQSDLGIADFNLSKGIEQLQGRRNLLIYMHDNPDPDAMAAAMGLKHLVENTTDLGATLALGGIVGRAENRAMVEMLKVPLIPAEVLNTDHFDTIAIVDSQPGTGNNSLPSGREVDIVIEAAGTEQAWLDAAALGRPGGTVVLFGGLPRDARPQVDAYRLHYDELTVRGSFHHTPATVRAALAFLASGAYPWERLVTHHVLLEELPALFADPPDGLLKAAVTP